MGFALGALAVAMQGSPPTVVIGWTALALAGLAAEQHGGRPGGRIAALGPALLAFPCLFGGALWARPSGAAPFLRPLGPALYRGPAGPALGARRAGAGLKIVLYDLSNLDALYRIASFFALALIALAVAYAYNRKATTSSGNV